MKQAIGYGTNHSFSSLGPMEFERRDVGAGDVQIEILYCGVCHSDVHQCENDWHNTVYPCVPGHEIVGRVTAVGSSIKKHKIGDMVGVGCMVDSCRECENCRENLEQYCEGPKGPIMTYNGPFKPDGTNTFGGYSNFIVVSERFVLTIPPNLDPRGVAPLLCAGITTYSPLRHWDVKAGQTVAVVGLGGLGHMAVKLAAAMGAEVTVFSSSKEKKDDAKRMGAKSFILTSDKDAFAALELKFDFILSTIPEPHDINPYVKMLKRDATLAIVGVLTPFALPTDNSQVAFHRRNVAGSLIGGIKETQEVLDFCGKNNITSDIELIPISAINDAFKRMKKGDVRYRFVIDVANTLGREK
jgi:uncharacterized zinc-type alcohol dehydrogenase-like protein